MTATKRRAPAYQRVAGSEQDTDWKGLLDSDRVGNGIGPIAAGSAPAI